MIETTITTAIVTFQHTNPEGIVRYEAYLERLNGNKCSIAAKASPLQCTLRGIAEAVNFNVLARACHSENQCEPAITVESRTKLRGRNVTLFFQASQFFSNFFCFSAPVDLKLLAASPTMLNMTVIPPANFGGDAFEMNFKGGEYPTQCYVMNWEPSQFCIYRDLTPATKYTFEYLLSNAPGGLDIRSEARYKSFTTPS